MVQVAVYFRFRVSHNTANGFHIVGGSDERYKRAGGNQSPCSALYQQVRNGVSLGLKLVKIKQTNAGYTLYFINANGTTVPVDADIVISAITFTLLREVALDVVLPSWKTNAINNIGYGTNSKLLLGFGSRVWRSY